MKVRYHAAKILKSVWPGMDFTNDGCTAAPDAWWKECCAEHDFYYGNDVGVSRAEADRQLFECMKSKKAVVSPYVYYAAVRLIGGLFWSNDNKMNWLKENEDAEWQEDIHRSSRRSVGRSRSFHAGSGGRG